ncbi:polynucleotide adenylyltransferase PcnB [Agaribacterium haliotis]|uniref:polynucleotide adenylyltransferase PcnB n=1 Tax=Agaribacterium haliotis TaxID=2013869 RepID=UPI000BB575E9|nr:polynucleotide adenylyltransferase PcnB [Agaribacterium haliotis]
MLKKLKKLFRPNTKPLTATRVSGRENGIDKRDISHNALKVIELLQDAGWQAYLVGGGVRDLLLGGHPKDFDVATDATPEQVQKVFRRARIIGRRFKIVHVRMGREVIEVTTFRGSHEEASGKQHAVQSDKGILLRDNVYGDLCSDAWRRDFSINALYYDPSDDSIVDYCNGLSALKQKSLSIIGEPDARYKEDPVRMLRAIRFMSKLGFSLDAASEQPIREHSDYLLEIPPARLFEEVLKLFMSGRAEAILEQLHHYHLLEHLFPAAADVFNRDESQAKRLLLCAAANTDERLAQGKRVTPAFIYAAFLWPRLQQQMQALRSQHRGGEQELLNKAATGVISEQLQRTAIPKRFLIPMREIWTLQLRLPRRDGRRAYTLLEHPRFRAAYDFLLLREQSGEELGQLGHWWTEFQVASEERRQALLESARNSQAPRKRKRPRRRKPAKNND